MAGPPSDFRTLVGAVLDEYTALETRYENLRGHLASRQETTISKAATTLWSTEGCTARRPFSKTPVDDQSVPEVLRCLASVWERQAAERLTMLEANNGLNVALRAELVTPKVECLSEEKMCQKSLLAISPPHFYAQHVEHLEGDVAIDSENPSALPSTDSFEHQRHMASLRGKPMAAEPLWREFPMTAGKDEIPLCSGTRVLLPTVVPFKDVPVKEDGAEPLDSESKSPYPSEFTRSTERVQSPDRDPEYSDGSRHELMMSRSTPSIIDEGTPAPERKEPAAADCDDPAKGLPMSPRSSAKSRAILMRRNSIGLLSGRSSVTSNGTQEFDSRLSVSDMHNLEELKKVALETWAAASALVCKKHSMGSLRGSWSKKSSMTAASGGSESSRKHMLYSMGSRSKTGDFTTTSGGQCATFLQRIVSNPTSRRRFIWELSGFVFVVYDCIMIPLQAFSPAMSDFGVFTLWFTAIFWTLDFVRSFFLGYYNEGLVEMRLVMIARKYVRTMCIPDAFIITIDWLLIVLEDMDQDANDSTVVVLRFNRSMRILRTLRLVRLLRLVRVFHLMTDIGDLVYAEHLKMGFHIIQTLLFIMLVSHFIACTWFFVGISGAPEHSWVHSRDLEHRELAYRYLTCLHWSLAQFTPAPIEIQPENAAERAFAIGVVLFGLVTFSSFVSSITGTMARLRKLQSEKLAETSKLNSYFDQHKISVMLTKCIFDFAKNIEWKHKRRVHEGDIAVMKQLPQRLLLQLRHEVYSPLMNAHPFFIAYRDFESGELYLQLCQSAFTECFLSPGEDVFVVNTQATGAYCIISGALLYIDRQGETQVSKEDWISEAALWIPQWFHPGQLSACTGVEYAQLKLESCAAILQRSDPFTWRFVSRYAQIFVVETLSAENGVCPAGFSDLCSNTLRRRAMVTEAMEDTDHQRKRYSREMSGKSTMSSLSRNVFHDLSGHFRKTAC